MPPRLADAWSFTLRGSGPIRARPDPGARLGGPSCGCTARPQRRPSNASANARRSSATGKERRGKSSSEQRVAITTMLPG
jgi:hypothetical protein